MPALSFPLPSPLSSQYFTPTRVDHHYSVPLCGLEQPSLSREAVQLALAGDAQRAVGGVPHSCVARVCRRLLALLRPRAKLEWRGKRPRTRVGGLEVPRLQVEPLEASLAGTCLTAWKNAGTVETLAAHESL